jgi:hypothetical protein
MAGRPVLIALVLHGDLCEVDEEVEQHGLLVHCDLVETNGSEDRRALRS